MFPVVLSVFYLCTNWPELAVFLTFANFCSCIFQKKQQQRVQQITSGAATADVSPEGGSVITKRTVKRAKMSIRLVLLHSVIQINFLVGSMCLISPTAYQGTGGVTKL